MVSRSEYFLIIIERTITPYVDKDIDKVLNYFVIQDKNILQQSYSSFKFYKLTLNPKCTSFICCQILQLISRANVT